MYSTRYNLIKEEVDKIILFDDVGAALKSIVIINRIADENKSKNNELSLAYKDLVFQLKFIALPLLHKQEVLSLLENNLQIGLDIPEYELPEKIRSFLVNNTEPQERDGIKKEILSIFQRSQATLSDGLLLNGSRPTLENWIKKYISAVGLNDVDAVKFNQFFVADKDYRILDDQKKIQVRNFFEYYERLKFSSLTARGLEETIPVANERFKGYIKNGELVQNAEVLGPEVEKLQNIVAEILNREDVADVLDELNAPLAVQASSVDNKHVDLPIVATSVEPAIIKPVSVITAAIKPEPLVVPKSAFAGSYGEAKPVVPQAEGKKPANYGEVRSSSALSYGETRPLKSVNNNEAKNKEIAQLTALATNYPEGSLERRVIEDEIRKVEQKQ
jgi:hypothetical protein